MSKKARASFELKKIIWDIAATVGKDNPTEIQQQLDIELEKLRKSGNLFEDAPSVTTISHIVKEINKLDREIVVIKLPFHVWKLRDDYESIKQFSRVGTRPVETIANDFPEQVIPKQLETRHQQMMLKTVETWIYEINRLIEHLNGKVHFPYLSYYTELRPIGTPKPTICPSYPFGPTNDPRTKVIAEYLVQHLCSEHDLRFKINDEDLFKIWENISSKELKARKELALRIQSAVVNLTGSLLDDEDRGPTNFFCDSIWIAVLTPKAIYYDPECQVLKPLHYDVWEAQCIYLNPQMTGEIIGRDETPEGAARYITWHKSLVSLFSKDLAVKELRVLRQKRLSVAMAINKILAKLSVDGYIPGNCNRCCH